MDTVFVINPAAGKGKNVERLIENISSAVASFGANTEIYCTKAVGDATKFVKKYCEEHGASRFIACGGDGTLGEVVNGAMDFSDAEIGVIPLGTGNDFCRNFEGGCSFLDVEAQINGETTKCDVIKYTSIIENEKKQGYCINMFNIGFDCNVADMTARMKKKPFISGSLAYLISIFVILIKKKGANLLIELDGKQKHKGSLLLTSVANGCFCGGGIKSNPLASIRDGLINVNIIYNISRLNFLTKLPFYMKGTHINIPGIESIIDNEKCKKLVLTPLLGTMRICIDGEIEDVGKTEFEIVPEAINFVVPKLSEKKHTYEYKVEI